MARRRDGGWPSAIDRTADGLSHSPGIDDQPADRPPPLEADELPVAGGCAPGFEAVHRAFVDNFAERGEVGASVCVIRDGQVVVDLWGGWIAADQTTPWQRDTLVNFYSVGKALIATLALRAVDDGGVTLDMPVAEIWPEFARHGKHPVTIRQALCHEAAVPAIREPLTDDDLVDWSTMTSALAATEPWWPIGTRHAYHTNTFGHLIGEIVRRTSGLMPGPALRSIADELNADVWFGVPVEEQHRCGEVIWAGPTPPAIDRSTLDGDRLMNALAHVNPPGYSSVGLVNSEWWRSLQLPSTAGHGTAVGLARFYAGLLDDDRLLSPPLLAEATRPQSIGPCPILGDDVMFGLGFSPTTRRRPLGPNPRSFGHFGTGGALGFADPDAGIAFGYVMNHVIPRWQSSRNRSLIDALYST